MDLDERLDTISLIVLKLQRLPIFDGSDLGPMQEVWDALERVESLSAGGD